MLPVNLDEYEPIARGQLEQGAYDYVAGGAEDEWTLRENRAAFDRWALRPRVLADVERCATETTVLGTPIAFPVFPAVTAMHRLCHPDGEIASSRGAHEAGTLFTVGTLSSCTLEEIRAASPGPLWFQLYAYKDAGINRMLIERAVAAGVRAIVLTVDAAIYGRRERDLRNAFVVPPAARARNLEGVIDLAARAGQPAANVIPADELRDRSMTWSGLEKLRALSPLPFVVKGLVTREDARSAAEVGVDGVIVSNHGGRQLDGTIATLDALPEVVEACAGRAGALGRPIEVLMDGGVRRGTHVLKALCLGARAVQIGRPTLYALAAAGADGVRHMLGLMQAEIRMGLALLGCSSIAQLTRDHVRAL
jgi:4-hydroxymandelate oxidase